MGETAKQTQRQLGCWCLFISEDGQAARTLVVVLSSSLHVVKPNAFIKAHIFIFQKEVILNSLSKA